MKWKNKIGRMWKVLCLQLFLIPLLFMMNTCAYASEQKTVRVGYYPVADYQDSADDGTYSGFGYDYYMQIQKYTHWKYEFVKASYAECVQMLMKGDIDLMSGLMKTSERDKVMLFSQYSVSNTQNKLYARGDHEDMYYEDYESFDGCTVAVMRGTLSDELEQYSAEHHFKVKLKEYENLMDVETALHNGEVDLAYATSISNTYPTKIVARLTKIPLYYAVAKSRPDVLAELNHGLQKITDNNPNFYAQMSDKYMVRGANATATFTREELDYLKSGQKVYVIINNDWQPISWQDPETGDFRGIAVDVMEMIREYSGLPVEYCTETAFNQLAVSDPSAIDNVIAILADDNTWAEKQNVMMSNHIVDASVVMVTKRGTSQLTVDEGTRIALPNRFYISWCMRNEFTQDQVTYYDTVEECLDAINAGKADATFVNELVATYYLSMLEYSNLFATANTGYNEDLSYAVNKDTGEPILGILDKSLLGIGSGELEKIVLQNSIAEQRLTAKGLFYSNPFMVLGVTVCFILILVGAGLGMHHIISRRKRMDLELQKEQETNSARTEFFMMISHELRTPLNAIVGYLNLAIEQSQKNGWETEYIRQSQGAAKQLSDIANDMLDYTRISSDSAQLREELFDLKDVIRTVEQNISLSAEKKELSFQFRIQDIDHEYIIGDKLRITQVMQNLLSNAVKFTNPGGRVTAQVSQEKLDDSHIELKFEAKDTGKGMSEEFLEKVCAPFNQSDRAYSRTHGGLGLGLYLTKYFLEAMNGHMEVVSKLKMGSTFSVTMPLKLADRHQIMEQAEDISFSKIRAMIGGPKEENDQEKELLKRLNVRCDAQTSGDMVLRRLQSRAGGDYAYDLCVLDESLLTEMPDILDKIADLKNPPKIFLFTDSREKEEQLTKNPAIRHVLYRPVFQSVLFDAMMNTFGECRKEEHVEEIPQIPGVHALIAEDNMVNADILTRILKKAGVEATICENGKLAADTFAQSAPGTYQIIFMDIQMPVMNGYEATDAIRHSTHAEAATVPIVAVSANAFPEDIAQSLKMGMNEHMSKPVNGNALYQVIMKYCGKAENVNQSVK